MNFGKTLRSEILSAEGVADIVNLTQHPLARINDSFAFCHHGGWYECDMQTHALCAGKMKPTEPYAMFNYVECNFDNLNVNDTRLCATNASLAYKDMWHCATGYGPEAGPGLLLASARYASALGVHSAPTVLLEGKEVGHSLTLRQVCDAYTGPKPKGCSLPTHQLVARVATGSSCHV